jgi:homoserine kinase type II
MEPELGDLVAAWPLAGPPAVRPVTSGTNNRTVRIETPGGAYLLRVYRNTRDSARVRYEHAVLLALQDAGLSFRVPAPLPSGDGTGPTLIETADGSLAALFPELPGAAPDRTDPAHLAACGAALAELHAALRRQNVAPPPAAATYGDLDRIHPLVPDPWRLPETLPLDGAGRARLTALLDSLQRAVPGLYATLPGQLCHNDYGPGNTLQIGGRTSAVLDFEFAAPDLRAIDVATGWYWSAGPLWGTGRELPAVRAFLAGYTAGARLTAAEGAATSWLARLQRAVALIHRAGRERAGLATAAEVAEQARRLLDLDRWLEANGAAVAAATCPDAPASALTACR